MRRFVTKNALVRVVMVLCFCLISGLYLAPARAQGITPLDASEKARFDRLVRAVERAGYSSPIVVALGQAAKSDLGALLATQNGKGVLLIALEPKGTESVLPVEIEHGESPADIGVRGVRFGGFLNNSDLIEVIVAHHPFRLEVTHTFDRHYILRHGSRNLALACDFDGESMSASAKGMRTVTSRRTVSVEKVAAAGQLQFDVKSSQSTVETSDSGPATQVDRSDSVTRYELPVAGRCVQIQPLNTDGIQAVPNRPTFSTTAEAVQRGVFEVEYGLEAADGHQNINGLLKFGLTKDLELRFANNPIERDAGIAGRGDSGVGFKYRLVEESGAWPTVSMLYTAVLPTASAGLGAGSLGHAAGILVSKDFGNHHLDFNEIAQWLGRQDAGGFDHNYFSALAYSHPITDVLGFSAEIAGFSRANAGAQATLTILEALGYSISPRLILDAGCYESVHGNLPRVTFFAGITYSVGNLYHLWHRR